MSLQTSVTIDSCRQTPQDALHVDADIRGRPENAICLEFVPGTGAGGLECD